MAARAVENAVTPLSSLGMMLPMSESHPFEEGNASSPLRRAAIYLLLLALSVGGFMVVRHFGSALTAPAPSAASPAFGAAAGGHATDTLMHVLLALAVVIITARAVGWVFTLLNQPAVIGEVLAGILLGPSLLGRVAPAASAYLLPTQVAPFLGILSQVGVVLYMFLVGLELDTKLMRTKSHSTVAISHASIVVPFLLGSVLALLLYPRLSTQDVPFTVFALFCGVSMSVTAFPVLARILTDRGTHTSRLGVIALTCAAVDDVTAWCLLAFVVSIANTQVGGGLLTAGLSVAYIAVMFTVVRPGVRKLVKIQETRGDMTKGVLAIIFVGMLLSALATEFIGIHAIFGAFALGALVPRESRVARDLIAKLDDVVVVLLLPAFFAYTGMRTKLDLVSGADQWALCALITLTASVGKFGGSSVAARATGLGWSDSAALGILMNTRGLMELVVLNIGLDLRVISPTLFAMLVIMALVTTIATTPVLNLIASMSRPKKDVQRGAEPASAV